MSNKEKHARLSPSSSRIWGWCPGSVALTEEALRRNPELGASSDASRRGTGFHQLMEKVFKERVAPSEFKGQIFNGALTVDDEVLIHANRLVDIVTAEIQDLQDPLAYVLVEEKLNPGVLFNRDDCWGTGDIVIVSPMTNSVIVIDIKYGVVQVAPSHPQVVLYLLGAMDKVNIFTKPKKQVGILKTGIYQPRNKGCDSRAPMKWQEYTLEDLSAWIDFFDTQAAKTDYIRPEYEPDEETCEWCKAVSICTARDQWALNKSGLNPNSLDLETDAFDLAEQAASVNPLDLDAAKISKLLNSEAAIMKMYKDLRTRALELAKQGVAIPYYKIVRSKGRRSWIKDEDLIIRTLRGWRFNKSDITKVRPIALSEVETLLKKKGKDAQLQKFREELVITPESKLVLVPETDERPAVDNLQEMFSHDKQMGESTS